MTMLIGIDGRMTGWGGAGGWTATDLAGSRTGSLTAASRVVTGRAKPGSFLGRVSRAVIPTRSNPFGASRFVSVGGSGRLAGAAGADPKMFPRPRPGSIAARSTLC